MKLSSPAFMHNQLIPARHTCDGTDVNPPLSIENVPPQARTLALIVDDPDAPSGTWSHWVLWNMDPNISEIAEDTIPSGARQGINDFRETRYNGPCPPSGTHRYYFKLYALDATLDLNEKTTRKSLENSMKGHIIEKTELIGLYKRR